MQIEITDHETVGTDAAFKPTDHSDILLDSETGRIAIIEDHEKALLIAVE